MKTRFLFNCETCGQLTPFRVGSMFNFTCQKCSGHDIVFDEPVILQQLNGVLLGSVIVTPVNKVVNLTFPSGSEVGSIPSRVHYVIGAKEPGSEPEPDGKSEDKGDPTQPILMRPKVTLRNRPR